MPRRKRASRDQSQVSTLSTQDELPAEPIVGRDRFTAKRKQVVISSRVPVSPQLKEIIEASPSKWCTVLEHPVKRRSYLNYDSVSVLDIQIDGDRFVPMPQGFASLRADQPDVLVSILLVLRLLSQLIAESMGFEQKKETKTAVVDGKKITTKTYLPIVKKNIDLFFTRKPDKTHPNLFNAYSLTIVEYGNEGSPGMVDKLQNILARNNQIVIQHPYIKKKAKPVTEPVDAVPRVDSEQWADICRCFNPSLFTGNWMDFVHDITHPNSPCKLENVFNLATNCKTAYNQKVHPDYCDIDNYFPRDKDGNVIAFSKGKVIAFPEGGINTWRIQASDFNDIKSFKNFYLPCVQQDVRSNLAARDAFQQKWGIESRKLADEMFSAQARTAPPADTVDLAAVAKRVADDDRALRASNSDDTGHLHASYYAMRQQMAKDVWIPMLEAINCPTGNCGDAIKAISSYSDDIVQSMGTFNSYRPQAFHNLSRDASHRVADAAEMDKFMTVLTTHQDCLLLLWSVLHTYSWMPMNLNHLLLGGPGIGKSFAISIVAQLMCPKSYVQATYSTMKAFAVPGKSNNFMVFLFEDAMASMYEKAAKAGGSNDWLNIHKQVLTALQIIVPTITMDPKRAAETVVADVCCTFLAAMNNASNTIDTAIRNRYAVTAATKSNDKANSGSEVISITQRMTDPAIKAAVDNMAMAFRETQVVVMRILQAEAAGILQRIDCAASDAFFAVLADVAAKYHLKLLEEKRDLTRFRLLCRVLAVLRVKDRLYQCPGAVFEDMKHHISHVLMANKYMFTTVEDAVFAAGMLARQWQDRALTNVTEAIVRLMFKNADFVVRQYKQDIQVPLDPDGKPPLDAKDKDSLNKPEFDQRWDSILRHIPQPGQESTHYLEAKDKAGASFVDYLRRMDAYNATDYMRNHWMYASATLGEGDIPAFVSLKQKANPTPADYVTHLTTHITPMLKENHLAREVQSKIEQLLEETVTVEREKVVDKATGRKEMVSKEYSKLVIDGNYVRLALPVIVQNRAFGSDLFFQCVQQACSILAAATKSSLAPGDHLLYGECETKGQCRYIWRIIKLTPAEALKHAGIDYEKMTRYHNASYASEVEKGVTALNQRAVDDLAMTPQYMRRLFSSETPWTSINSSVDSLAAVRRAKEIGLSLQDMHMHPSSDPIVAHKQFRLRDKADGVVGLQYTYPQDLITGRRQDDEEKKDMDVDVAMDASHFTSRTVQRDTEQQLAKRPRLMSSFMEDARKHCKADEEERFMLSQRQLQHKRQTILDKHNMRDAEDAFHGMQLEREQQEEKAVTEPDEEEEDEKKMEYERPRKHSALPKRTTSACSHSTRHSMEEYD